MQEKIDTPLKTDELVSDLGSSRRQIERLFATHLKTSPSRYYRDLRLDHARGLLRETDMTATEVTVACGFSSTGLFRKSFRQRFGTSPKKYRAS